METATLSLCIVEGSRVAELREFGMFDKLFIFPIDGS